MPSRPRSRDRSTKRRKRSTQSRLSHRRPRYSYSRRSRRQSSTHRSYPITFDRIVDWLNTNYREISKPRLNTTFYKSHLDRLSCVRAECETILYTASVRDPPTVLSKVEIDQKVKGLQTIITFILTSTNIARRTWKPRNSTTKSVKQREVHLWIQNDLVPLVNKISTLLKKTEPHAVSRMVSKMHFSMVDKRFLSTINDIVAHTNDLWLLLKRYIRSMPGGKQKVIAEIHQFVNNHITHNPFFKTNILRRILQTITRDGCGYNCGNRQLQMHIGDKFVDLLPGEGDIHWSVPDYSVNAILKYRSYKTELNRMSFIPFDQTKCNENKHTYIQNYVKCFLNTIWNHVSNQNYPGRLAYPPRPNHGTLNHLRAMCFGSHFINVLLKARPGIFNTTDTAFNVMLLCSTPFESIMRIDEKKSAHVLGSFTNNTYYTKLYGKEMLKYNADQMSPHQLASSCFYKVVMTICFGKCVPHNTINMLTRCVSYYYTPNDLVLTINPPSVDFRFFLYYTIIVSGHYLDHCRGAFSNMIQNPDIRTLLDLLNISEQDRKELIIDVLRTLMRTETSTPTRGIDVSKVNSRNMVSMCDNYIIRKRRWGGVRYLYDNFELAWKTTKMPQRIHTFVNMLR